MNCLWREMCIIKPAEKQIPSTCVWALCQHKGVEHGHCSLGGPVFVSKAMESPALIHSTEFRWPPQADGFAFDLGLSLGTKLFPQRECTLPKIDQALSDQLSPLLSIVILPVFPNFDPWNSWWHPNSEEISENNENSFLCPQPLHSHKLGPLSLRWGFCEVPYSNINISQMKNFRNLTFLFFPSRSSFQLFRCWASAVWRSRC